MMPRATVIVTGPTGESESLPNCGEEVTSATGAGAAELLEDDDDPGPCEPLACPPAETATACCDDASTDVQAAANTETKAIIPIAAPALTGRFVRSNIRYPPGCRPAQTAPHD